jgi:hypothetical protein
VLTKKHIIVAALALVSVSFAQNASAMPSTANPNSLNRKQFELSDSPHKEFNQALNEVTPSPSTPNPINYPGSPNTPAGHSESQTHMANKDAFQKVKATRAGSAPGKAFGPDATTQPYFQSTNPKLDGPTPPPTVFRKTEAGLIEFQPDSPAGVGACAEISALRMNNEINGTGGKVLADVTIRKFSQDIQSEVGATMRKTEAGMGGIAELASEAMSEEFNSTWVKMLTLSATPLINVGNSSSGSKCSASKPIKTYSNSIYIVQQAYTHIYLPIALLLLLPGAVATQLKCLLSAGILNNGNDDDAVSPFSGILKVLVAIFLIPASQLIVSYSIDVGNSTQYEISRHINYVNLFLYADEQVFAPPEDSFPGKLLPGKVLQSLGKLQGTPEKLAKQFNMSKASVMLQALANSLCQAAAFGLVISCAFQMVMACYLLLMGPVAAAFYAWPHGVGSLFPRVFAGWVDGMVNLALWRFWWCVVLLIMDTRLGWLSVAGLLDIYSMWELMMFISFLVIMTYVPFNPFDFKPGEMVQQIMSKSDEAVQEASNKK